MEDKLKTKLIKLFGKELGMFNFMGCLNVFFGPFPPTFKAWVSTLNPLRGFHLGLPHPHLYVCIPLALRRKV